jgi:hypothetical protein
MRHSQRFNAERKDTTVHMSYLASSHRQRAFIGLVLLILMSAANHLSAQTLLGTGINFSRSGLKLNNALLNGTFDVRFKIFDAATGGTQVGTTLTKTGVAIAGGKLPTLALDFGNDVFTGEARWIEVRARQGGNPFAPTAPRQRLRPVPFALSLPGLYTQQNDECPNIIGGFAGNFMSDGAVGATISGGGLEGFENSVTTIFGTIGGGRGNTVIGSLSTIAGGDNNTASGSLCFIGGGEDNITTNARATVSGGSGNTASGNDSTVAGGTSNTASGFRSAVGGGGNNLAEATSTCVAGGSNNTASVEGATVGGGRQNVASGFLVTIGGGQLNAASGQFATIPGGQFNQAVGNFSFAAGRRAKAFGNGTFIWADSTDADFTEGAANRFAVRATGGAEIFTSANLSTGVILSAGGGAWSSVSDRAVKSNIEPVDPTEALYKVLALPISTWNYTTQDQSIRHIGPMAQDFHAAFGVGEDDKHITTIDADGVALAAIQGLHQVILENAAVISAQQRQISDLTTRLADLEEKLVAHDAQQIRIDKGK